MASSVFQAHRKAASNIQDMFSYWRDSWIELLQSKSLSQDVVAGFTVAAVAVPLNIALAVICGLPPVSGLIAGAVGGFLAAAFGGSSLQVTGPAAALNLMVLTLNLTYGPVGVAAACCVIGLVQFILAFSSAGKVIRFVPEALLAGFTTGVGVKILDNQIPDLLGFEYTVAHIARMIHTPHWLHEVSWLAVVSGLIVAFFVTAGKEFKRFPSALVGIAMVTFISVRLQWPLERVGAVAATLPAFSWPALAPDLWPGLIAAAIPLGLLAGIESLLSAQAIDRMTAAKKRHHSNLELFGQGTANFVTGLLGGMPVSGVIVRSSVNAQCGAKTRVSSLIHAALLMITILYLGNVIGLIPLSALAGLLCVIGWRLVEVKTFVHLFQKKRLEALGFFLAAAGTVSGYMLSGLVLGGVACFISHKIEKWKGQTPPSDEDDFLPTPDKKQIRAHINLQSTGQNMRPLQYTHLKGDSNWLRQIKQRAQVAASSFVHQKASVIGRVILGEHVHIAAESSIRADEGSPFYIGSNSNIQDGVVIHALQKKWLAVGGEYWAVYIGENVSVAHQALIHGPCYIGNDSFVGFKSVVHDSTVGPHCYIGIGAIVVGVEIPSHRYVPHGMVVDSMEKVALLPPVSDQHMQFNEDVVQVNKGLAAAYNKQLFMNTMTKSRIPVSDPLWDEEVQPQL